MNLTKEAKTKFDAFCKRLEIGYDVDSVQEHFSVTPKAVASIMGGWKSKVAFLTMISMIPVQSNAGDVLNMTPNKVTRKIDTAGSGVRTGASVVTLGERSYKCNPTPQDIKITFALLNSWAHLDNFDETLKGFIDNARSADLLTIGWHGTSDAATSNIGTNTMLQDCGIGWFKTLETDYAAHYVTDGAAADTITVKSGGDFANLDALTVELKNMIPQAHRTGQEVVILGTDLVAQRDAVLFAGVSKPEDTNYGVANRCGGLPLVEPPHDFPSDAIFVGDPRQLQIYVQTEGTRKAIKEEHQVSAIVDYLETELDWQIGDPKGVVVIPTGVISFT